MRNIFSQNQADATICLVRGMQVNVTGNVFNENKRIERDFQTIYFGPLYTLDQFVVKNNVFANPDASYEINFAATRNTASAPRVLDLSMNFWNSQNVSGILRR